jgi:rhodanese-related sulfurtransferase
MASWIAEGRPVEQVPQVSVEDLQRSLNEDPGGIQVVDVRRASEWQGGHIPGAMLKPLDNLAKTLRDLDPTRPIAVHCKGGYRSSAAASLLQRAGYSHVMDVKGGFDAWRACNLPVAGVTG